MEGLVGMKKGDVYKEKILGKGVNEDDEGVCKV